MNKKEFVKKFIPTFESIELGTPKNIIKFYEEIEALQYAYLTFVAEKPLIQLSHNIETAYA